jgi:hypothetical protein
MDHYCKYCGTSVKNREKHEKTERHKKNKDKFDNVIRYKIEKLTKKKQEQK